MSKKLFISLASVLAIAAFAVVPVAAQAAGPHYYGNLTKLEEGKKFQTISYGHLALEAGGKSVECENAVGGWVENPSGEGPGESETEAWSAYNCKNAECEAVAGKMGVLFENEKEPGNSVQLHWPQVLEEKVKGTIRLKASNVKVSTHCQNSHAAPKEVTLAENVSERTTTEINLGPVGSCTTASPGSSTPQVTSATKIGVPGKTKFGEGSGELECGAGGKGKTTGSLSTFEFNPESGEPIALQTKAT